ncbi:MAG TPA: carbohydrate ABC transporter permease, partial [Bacilli bacterium]|nr:carbohydrate ABC transporter permease [Bacilli bacterium]
TMINPSRFHRSQIKFILILLPIVLVMLVPIVFIISHAFKPLDELYAYPPKIFASRITFDNFKNLFEAAAQTEVPFSRYLFNSIVACILVIILSLAISSLGAYAFSFLNFKGKKLLFSATQIAIMFVPIAVAVPRYMVLTFLGITNTFMAHIIPLLAMPVGIFLLKQFMDQIPRDLIDAASMDGANKLQFYWYIVLPLVKPALATVAILAFQASWNNVESSQLYLVNENLKTLPYYFGTLTMGLSSIASQGMAAAASLIIFLPNIIVFIILQSNVMSTMAHSGLKG